MTDPCEAYHIWYYETRVWFSTNFLGVPAQKSVSDLWNYQEILTEMKPSLVVEFGTLYGGSTLFFATILGLVSQRSKVLSVDIDHGKVDERARRHRRVELMQCDTTLPAVATRIISLRRKYPGNIFCILDSNHAKNHVLAELMLVRSVTRAGDYVVVEDGNINGHPVWRGWCEGPSEALEEYKARYPDDYSPDLAREQKFGFTFAPAGFLIRRGPA